MDSPQAAGSINIEKFNDLVARRRRLSWWLTATILGIYYGFILILAFNKSLLSIPIGEHVTLWLPVGIGVIITAWVLTGIYVRWANETYDRLVASVKEGMKERA
ncbi:MAG: DUF485 domain-containing protein [Desulfovibrionaceae bacterium]